MYHFWGLYHGSKTPTTKGPQAHLLMGKLCPGLLDEEVGSCAWTCPMSLAGLWTAPLPNPPSDTEQAEGNMKIQSCGECVTPLGWRNNIWMSASVSLCDWRAEPRSKIPATFVRGFRWVKNPSWTMSPQLLTDLKQQSWTTSSLSPARQNICQPASENNLPSALHTRQKGL